MLPNCGYFQILINCSIILWAYLEPVIPIQAGRGDRHYNSPFLPKNGCPVTQLCPTLCDPMDCRTPGFPVAHHLPEFAQVHVHCIGDALHHLILWRPLLLLPSIFPSIRDFSSESSVLIRWPKYWSFSFSISPSSEYSWLISLKMELVWTDLLASFYWL